MNKLTPPLFKKAVLGAVFTQSEVVIAFVGAVGVDLGKVKAIFEERLKTIGYNICRISISQDIIPQIVPNAKNFHKGREYDRISKMMDVGNGIRAKYEDNGFLSLGVAAEISHLRSSSTKLANKSAYLVHSLKRPEEVRQLREIYPHGFYLVGVHSDRDRRRTYLTSDKRMTDPEADKLMDRDMNEVSKSGQRIIDTFHLADFFVRLEANDDKLKNSVWRITDLMFGNPHSTPAFSEHAMFLAFAASLRSGDLSRQVGAVIARDGEILATGANDCPQAGGGLYWPIFCPTTQAIKDVENGRDSVRGADSNNQVQGEIINSIVKALTGVKGLNKGKIRQVLEKSPISDLTEFGRVVHAEMEALLACARKGISTKGATMYCTTFPCHNCAKHIVAAGIDRVIFIEPYLKSKAIILHKDSIKIDYSESEKTDNTERNNEEDRKMVKFQPFVGVGPRRFFDLFSMRIGYGKPVNRKDQSGLAIKWKPEGALLRIQMLPKSYIELELEAVKIFQKARSKKTRR